MVLGVYFRCISLVVEYNENRGFWAQYAESRIMAGTPLFCYHIQSETFRLHRNTLSHQNCCYQSIFFTFTLKSILKLISRLLGGHGLRKSSWHWPPMIRHIDIDRPWPTLDRTSQMVSAYHSPLSPPIAGNYHLLVSIWKPWKLKAWIFWHLANLQAFNDTWDFSGKLSFPQVILAGKPLMWKPLL